VTVYKPNRAGLHAVVAEQVDRAALWTLGRITDNLTRLVYDQPESPTYKRTGDLRRSYQVGPRRVKGGSIERTIGTNLFYAPFVEFGTRRVKARPAVGKAVAAARRRFG